jgi:glycosyltransferase involved in cell wall biosynthesis
MRLCFLTERLLRGWGVDHVVHRLADGLARRGHEVDVVCLYADGSQGPAAYRVRILEPPAGPYERLEDRIVAAPGLLTQRPYDLYVATLYPFFGVAARLGLPVVHFEFGVVDPRGQPPQTRLILDRIRREAAGHQRRARRVATISRFLVQEQIAPEVHPRTDVVHLGADSYGEPVAAGGVRARLGLSETAEIVGYLGRIERATYKGLDDLVAIVTAVRRRRPAVRLLLVGLCDRATERYFAGLERVDVRPNVTADDVPAYLAAMDVVASASRWEGFNLPIAEAQYHRRPVVTYDVGAHPEVVAPSAARVETAELFADALVGLLADPAARARRGAEARRFAERFTWVAAVDAFEACLERAADQGRR